MKKHPFTKRTVLMAILVSLTSFSYGQKMGLEEGMKNGFDLYNTGEEHWEWIEAAESLADLSKKYPNEWLPYYWASYMYTQIARASFKNPPEGITSEKMVDNAQKYLDLASARIKDKTPEQEVDFHMLQGLTYSFRKDDKEKFKELKEIETTAAIRKDPNNPTLLVNLGLDLFFRGDYQSVYAARVLFLQARQKFNSRLKPRYMSTHFAEQWVNYWEPQAQKKILELTKQ